MSMRRTYKWHEMSGPEVAALAEETDVAILPIGCVEMHGPHLPMGTDILMAHHLAVQAAQREPVMVGPRIPFGLAQPSMAVTTVRDRCVNVAQPSPYSPGSSVSTFTTMSRLPAGWVRIV